MPAAEEPMDPLNAPAYGPVEIPVIQDTIVIEQEAAVPIKVTLNGIIYSCNFITVEWQLAYVFYSVHVYCTLC